MPDTTSSSTIKRSPSSRLLLILLGVVGVAYMVSLPWQRQQWEVTRKIREENALQEARIRALEKEHETVRTAESRLQTGGGDTSSRLDAIRIILSQGDSRRGGALLREIEKDAFEGSNPTGTAALASTLAGMYQDAGWVDRALINAQRALDRDPNSVEALLRIGVIEAQVGWQQECRAHIEMASKLAPQAAEPHIALALLYEQVGAYKQGEQELLAASKLRSNDEHILQLLFRNQMSQGQYDKALETAQQALKLFPTSLAFLGGRAEAMVEQALSIPGKPDKARFQEGMELVQQYIRLSPDNMNAHFLLGRIYQRLGDEESALREWEMVFASDQKTPTLAINLGRLLVRKGDRQRGQQMLEAGEKQRAEGTDYNRLLITAGMMRNDIDKQKEFARWCQERKRYSHALLGWNQVLKLKPDDAEAQREIAVCIERRGG